MRPAIYGALTVLALAGPGAGQALSGAYTINPSLPAGGGNYQTFAAAVADLSTFGVGGPVTFTVANGSYLGFTYTGTIAGASATNVVVFAAASQGGVVLTGPGPSSTQTVRLGTSSTAGSGPSYVTLQGFVVRGATSGAGIMAAGGSNVSILDCTVENCGAGIAFVTVNGATVEGCLVTGCAGTPGTLGSTTHCGGISAYLNTDGFVVRRNRVLNCTTNGIFCGSTADSSACDGAVIVNNFVAGCPGGSSYPGGIVVRRAPNAVIVNNSVRMPATSIAPGIHLMQMSSTTVAHMWPLAVTNNVVRHSGAGACVAINTNAVASPQPPDAFDFNLYDVGPTAALGGVATGTSGTSGYSFYNTFAQWTAVATPNLATSEGSSSFGSAQFVADDDLHVTCASGALFNGSPSAYAPTDFDGDARSATTPCRGADEIAPGSAYIDFAASVVVGPAPLSVTFTNSSCTLSPPFSAWAWDFQNDGSTDSTLQNPSFTYLTPGTYSVKLTGTDAAQSTVRVKTALIVVQPYVLTAVSTGGGTGDLTVTGVPAVGAPGTVQGFLFISFATTQPVGTGGFFGLDPDLLTFLTLQQPATPGGLLHWVPTPGFYPEVPLVFPPGSLVFLAGMTGDFVQVDLKPPFALANVSNVSRTSF